MADNLTRKAYFGKNAVFFLILIALLSGNQSFATENPANHLQSKKARELTIEAVKLIEKDRWTEGKQKIAASQDALAAKIFYWLQLTSLDDNKWTNELFIKLSQFVRRNPEWPGISKMVVRAEGVMPENLSNDEVIAWYQDFSPQTTYGMERYMDAMLINGRQDQARKFLEGWWASTLTSRDQQKRIFQKYGGYLTIEAHKKRFDALLHNAHYDNARAIAGVLGQGYPELAEARIALARNEGNVNALIARVPSYLQDDPGLLYERLHWRRVRDLDDGAVEILAKDVRSSDVINPNDWWLERHIIIRRLLEKKDYKKAYDLASKHMQDDGVTYADAQWMAGWLALQFMNRPTDAYERFSSLYEKVTTPISLARAAYWAGRAAHDLRQNDLALKWYRKAAEFQTVYYGQLAAAALSQNFELPPSKLPNLTAEDNRNFEKSELFQSAMIFKAAGQRGRYDAFINAFLEHNTSPKAYRFAAEKIAESEDFYSAVKIAKKASYKGLFLTKQAYPTITKHLTNINAPEWALVHGLIRQESMFDYDAKSHAGALGLMQIMPATAKEVSKKNGYQFNQQWLTAKPQYNLQLGSAYLQMLLNKFENSYPLAIAAYNAGPSRVVKWLELFGDPRTGDINMIDWVELIPIYETRNYVQRVLENTYIYRLRLDNIQTHPKEDLHIAFHKKP